jgi:hypothetical protein
MVSASLVVVLAYHCTFVLELESTFCTTITSSSYTQKLIAPWLGLAVSRQPTTKLRFLCRTGDVSSVDASVRAVVEPPHGPPKSLLL